MRSSVFLITTCAMAAFLGGCATSSVYEVTVVQRGGVDPMRAPPVEGAMIEVRKAGSQAIVGTESTNAAGEASFDLWTHERYFLTVTFDGTTDCYLLRTDQVPAWTEGPIPPDDPRSPLRFAPGPPASRPTPAWAVSAVRLP